MEMKYSEKIEMHSELKMYTEAYEEANQYLGEVRENRPNCASPVNCNNVGCDMYYTCGYICAIRSAEHKRRLCANDLVSWVMYNRKNITNLLGL